MHLLPTPKATSLGSPEGGPGRLEMVGTAAGLPGELAVVTATLHSEQGWVACFISRSVPTLTRQRQQGASCAAVKL